MWGGRPHVYINVRFCLSKACEVRRYCGAINSGIGHSEGICQFREVRRFIRNWEEGRGNREANVDPGPVEFLLDFGACTSKAVSFPCLPT